MTSNPIRSLMLGALIAFASGLTVLSQAVWQLDEFGQIPCSAFLSRMDSLWQRTKDSDPNLRVFVVYFGARYRRSPVVKDGNEVIRLEYPHRSDAANLAKAIPLYLTTKLAYDASYRESMRDRIVLIDGGFREDYVNEIWMGTTPPRVPPSLIDPATIKFRDDKPRGTPDFTRCYENVY